MADLVHSSPLAHRDPPQDLVMGLREMPNFGMIDLRGLGSDRKFMSTCKSILEVDLPKTPRTSVSWGENKVFWLSPDQWLILCPRARTADLLASLVKALGGTHALAVDVSDMRAVIRLEGKHAATVLLKGCALDLESDAYPPGTVRRLRFAEIAALLHVVEEDVFDLFVFRSYADYAWDWLVRNARSVPDINSSQVHRAP
jgi:sarcosine oxidase subunit gamma